MQSCGRSGWRARYASTSLLLMRPHSLIRAITTPSGRGRRANNPFPLPGDGKTTVIRCNSGSSGILCDANIKKRRDLHELCTLDLVSEALHSSGSLSNVLSDYNDPQPAHVFAFPPSHWSRHVFLWEKTPRLFGKGDRPLTFRLVCGVPSVFSSGTGFIRPRIHCTTFCAHR